MTAQQFADLLEASVYVLGDIASWWLVFLFAGSVLLGIVMLILGFARFLLGKRVGIPPGYNPVR